MNTPLHKTAADKIRQMIFTGDEYSEGDKLPTEPVLAKKLGVSRATLREALKLIENEGLILRRHGLGTFIKTLKPALTLDIHIPRSVTAMIDSLKFIPGTSHMKVTSENVFPDDVERLNLSPGEQIVRIERIRTANSQPVAYTIDVVPSWALGKYPQWDGASNFSLIDHLTYKCGVRFGESKSTLIPLHNIQSVAEKLEIDPSSHIFFFEGVDYDRNDAPVLFSREYFSPWIFRFSVNRQYEEL